MRPKMADHFYEPDTDLTTQTPGLSSVSLALQNVKIRIGIEVVFVKKDFPIWVPICRKAGVCPGYKVPNNFEFLPELKLKG